MAIRLTELLERVPPEVEGRVKRVRDQTRSVLQDALRTECRLAMRTSEETEENRSGAQVPLEIAPGYPDVLEAVTFPDDVDLMLLVGRYRTSLEQTASGASRLLKLREELARRAATREWIGVKEEELASTYAWAESLLARLDDHDPVNEVLAFNEDILGVYEYEVHRIFTDEYSVNRASIKIYWGVVGLISELLGCAVEDLTIVVLVHELAHAYTQLGADIDGRRWPAWHFASAEAGLKEGLAQYYTERVLARLERRYGAALGVYRKLLLHQSDVYKTHLPWIETYSPEVVRRAMLEVRRWNEGKLEDFNRRLANAQKQLHRTTTEA